MNAQEFQWKNVIEIAELYEAVCQIQLIDAIKRLSQGLRERLVMLFNGADRNEVAALQNNDTAKIKGPFGWMHRNSNGKM